MSKKDESNITNTTKLMEETPEIGLLGMMTQGAEGFIGEEREAWRQLDEKRRQDNQEARAFLAEKYPQHADPVAYWNEP